jgi:hypothetical protein
MKHTYQLLTLLLLSNLAALGQFINLGNPGLRVGIGFSPGQTPRYPLSFPNVVGDKISLWNTDPSSATAAHYGLGVQGFRLQLFAPTTSDNIVFGIGNSANFTENVRFTGDGKVGIGTNNPQAKLDVLGKTILTTDNSAPALEVFGPVKLATGNQGVGKVLTSDLIGNATWQTPPGVSYGTLSLTVTPRSYDLSNGSTSVLVGQDQLDDDVRYNPSTNIYTVGQAGYYLITGMLRLGFQLLASNSSYNLTYKLQVVVNGTTVRTGINGQDYRDVVSGSFPGPYTYDYYEYPASLNTAIKCNAGDQITLRISATGSAPSNCYALEGQFAITKQ